MTSPNLTAAANSTRKPADVARTRLAKDIVFARGIGRRVAIVRVADLEALLAHKFAVGV